MITLIWKELRENVKWALLAMIVLGAAEVYALYHTQDGQLEYSNYNHGITLCKDTFLTVTTFGCAAIGFLLGLIQVLPELKRDRWAALLHRPVSRSVIFFGKAIAGMLLYALATAPPFLFCVWLAAAPGHFVAPFVPGLALAGTADTVTGLLYYFAALTVALQSGGWPGLRALPLLAAIHVSFFVVSTHAFSDAAWAALLMAAVACIAAWGAIRNQESFSRRPWVGKLAFLTVVFYGICGLGDLTRYVFNAMVSQKDNEVRYALSDAGTPLKISYVDNVIILVQDLDGNPPQNPNYKPDRVRNHLRYLSQCCSYIGDSHGWVSPFRHDYYRRSNTYLWANRSFSFPRLEQWYYLEQQRSAVGVLPDRKVAFRRLDERGFQPMSTEPLPFVSGANLWSFSSEDDYILWDRNSIRFVNLAKEQIIEPILPAPERIFGVESAGATTGNVSVSVLTVALATQMAIYDQKGSSLIASLPYHQDVDRWGNVEVGLNSTKDHFYLWYHPSVWIPRKIAKTMPSYLEDLNAHGQVLQSYALPPLPGSSKTRPLDAVLAQYLQSPAFFFGGMVYEKSGAALGNSRLKKALTWQLGGNWKRTKEAAIWIIILSSLLAGITLCWARRVRFGWKRAWMWAGMSFAFNLAGFIIFRLVADWPRLVSCSACGRPRPVDVESCPHCGGGWPEITRSATEIFDPPSENSLHAAASA